MERVKNASVKFIHGYIYAVKVLSLFILKNIGRGEFKQVLDFITTSVFQISPSVRCYE